MYNKVAMVNQSFELNAISAGIASFKVATDQNPYLEPALMPALLDIVQALKTDETIRVVVVEGDSQYFSAVRINIDFPIIYYRYG